MPTTDTKQELERSLEKKYSTVISQAKEFGARIEKSHIENNKLVLKIAVPNEDTKNKIWDAAKTVDRDVSDLALQIHVEHMGGGGSTGQTTGSKTYTVQSGDTLSEISQRYYGDPNQYMKIFNANKNILKDPDKIQVGQKLNIPE